MDGSYKEPMPRLPLRPAALFALLLLSWAGPARAADPIVGMRSLALGESMRAAASGAEGVLLNPSGIALLRQYTVTGFYSLRLFDDGNFGHAAHVSIADSVTQRRIAVGLYYNFIYETPSFSFDVAEGGTSTRMAHIRGQRECTLLMLDAGRCPTILRTGHEVGLASAFPLGDRFILGVTTKYGYYSETAQLPDDQLRQQLPNANLMNPAIDKDKVYDFGSVSNVVSFDIGMTLRLFESLNVGVVGQNLWGHGKEMPTLLGMGLAYAWGTRLLLAADALVNFTGNEQCTAAAPRPPCSETGNRITVRAGGGAELTLGSRVPLRAGYLFDSTLNSQHVTAGLGYFTPRYAFDFGLRQRVVAGAETVLLFGFRVFRD